MNTLIANHTTVRVVPPHMSLYTTLDMENLPLKRKESAISLKNLVDMSAHEEYASFSLQVRSAEIQGKTSSEREKTASCDKLHLLSSREKVIGAERRSCADILSRSATVNVDTDADQL